MSSTQSTQKIILAMLALAGLLLLGPYMGISLFGRPASSDQEPTIAEQEEQGLIKPSNNAAKTSDLDLDISNTKSAEPSKPSTQHPKKELSDIEDLLGK